MHPHIFIMLPCAKAMVHLT
uniref:Uncharacterized protein n=1 Tax=Rhizophora mucronata TaxID=61149 RepID=A0A2P2QU81_RHIMU